jgi:small neutral amino acid transporter SnatA (MarC family)
VSKNAIRILFIIAGGYDAVLAFAFLLFGSAIFQAFGVTPPTTWATSISRRCF